VIDAPGGADVRSAAGTTPEIFRFPPVIRAPRWKRQGLSANFPNLIRPAVSTLTGTEREITPAREQA